MIHWTNDDVQVLAHVAEVMTDRMLTEGGYTDEDRATMAKLEELAKAGPAVTVTGEAPDYQAELDLFQRVVSAELDNWVPNASQRLLHRASLALNKGYIPNPATASHGDCGPERGSHALVTAWAGSLYVYRCASCFRLYRA